MRGDRVSDYVTDYIGPGANLTVSEFLKDRHRYPKIWSRLLMTCAKTQFDFLRKIWCGSFDVWDPEVQCAFRGLVLAGLFPKVVDPESQSALDLIRAAVAGYKQKDWTRWETDQPVEA